MFNPLYTSDTLMSTLADSEDPDESLHKVAFHQGLHCLPIQKRCSKDIYNFIWKL